MKLLCRLASSLHTQTIYKRTLLTRILRTPKLTNVTADLQYRSPHDIYKLIMLRDRYDLIPVYLRYYHKFLYIGVNRKTNYQRYLTNIDTMMRSMIKKREEIKSKSGSSTENTADNAAESEDFDTNPQQNKNPQRKLALYTWTIGVLILLLALVLEPRIDPSAMKMINSKELANDSTLLAKLFEGVTLVKIRQIVGSVCTYQIQIDYANTPSQKYKYVGDVNNLLAMLQSYDTDKLQHTPIEYVNVEFNSKQAFWDVLGLFLPFLGIAISIFFFRMINPDTLMSKLSPKKSYKIQGLRDIKVKFADVAGMEQAKREITEFVDFLKHGQKYKAMGASIPKGALLTGPPGTGKTMLAKACAGEAGVTFFYISGSEFVQLFVGVGASKVRQLFNRARMQAPSIIFIDEIDAIGKKRQTSRNQEKDSTLNQLLVQMDGFSSHETVIVLAATNRKDVLDNALTRPGRFDRMVEVTLPDIQAREAIFMVHLRPLKVNPGKKLQDVAKRLAELSPGFSGADIANLCNEAAIIATRRGQTYIEDKDFEDASERITAGYEKKGLVTPKTKKRVAYHEAGHAVCGWFLKGGDPLVKLTIIPRSKGALGYAQYLPKSSYIRTRNDLIDQLAILMGGLTSEEIHFGQLSSGASDDLQKVYQVSRQMVASFGMGSHTYNLTLDEESHVRKESQFLSKKMDQDMMELVNQGYERCKEILGKKKEMLAELAELLLEKQTINGEDIKRVLGERPKFN